MRSQINLIRAAADPRSRRSRGGQNGEHRLSHDRGAVTMGSETNVWQTGAGSVPGGRQLHFSLNDLEAPDALRDFREVAAFSLRKIQAMPYMFTARETF
jgi:hypothetical protein